MPQSLQAATASNTSLGIVLKPGREKSVRNKHCWVFSGAVQSSCQFEDGDVLPVYSATGHFLGSAICSNTSQICCRFLTFDNKPYQDVIREQISAAIALRGLLFAGKQTNAYRLIHAEGDF